MEPLFDVCFAGELLEEHELQSVRQKLQKLFNANPDTLDKLFSGKMQVLKRGCDESTALKYQQAMAKAGAKAVVRTQSSPNPAASSDSAPSPAAGLVLAPPGSDVLRPDERAEEIITEIDTSSLDIEEMGSNLETTPAETGEAPDTSHLSVADVGEDIPNLPSSEAAVQPDTDFISLSPEGTDFSDCSADTPAAPEVDLTNIELAPAGSDVLEEQYKKKNEDAAPDTSHIALE